MIIGAYSSRSLGGESAVDCKRRRSGYGLYGGQPGNVLIAFKPRP
jgi:hypothetical protein